MEVVADISKELEYEKQKRATRDDIGLVIMEGLTQEQIRKEAQELYRAEREKTVLRPFTEKYPKIEPAESYRIQLALIEMKKAEGAKVVGKKIGRISKAMPKMLNVDQPDYGHILDGMVLQDGVVFRVGELIQPKIEPAVRKT